MTNRASKIGDRIREKLVVRIEDLTASALLAKARTVNSQLAHIINDELGEFLKEMVRDTFGTPGTPSYLNPYLQNRWQPLADETIRKKGHNGYFFDTGELAAALEAITSTDITSTLGGYSNQSAHVTYKSNKYKYDFVRGGLTYHGRLIKNQDKLQATLSFSTLHKLFKARLPEQLLDKITPPLSGTTVSQRLGVAEHGAMSYYRPLLRPYAAYYLEHVLPGKIRMKLNAIR